MAKRDSEWMGKIYKFLRNVCRGASQMKWKISKERKTTNCDVTYGTNNEFGFDYLRDNMKYNVEEMVQRDHFFCIVDEVDSVF